MSPSHSSGVERSTLHYVLSLEELRALQSDHICWRGEARCTFCRLLRGLAPLRKQPPLLDEDRDKLAVAARQLYEANLLRERVLREIQTEMTKRPKRTAATSRRLKRQMADAAAHAAAARQQYERTRLRLITKKAGRTT